MKNRLRDAFREAFGNDDDDEEQIEAMVEKLNDFMCIDAIQAIAVTCSKADLPVTVGSMLFVFTAITCLVKDGHLPRETFLEMAAMCWDDETMGAIPGRESPLETLLGKAPKRSAIQSLTTDDVDDRSANLMEEAKEHNQQVADGLLGKGDSRTRHELERIGFEGWMIQKLASLQLTVEALYRDRDENQ